MIYIRKLILGCLLVAFSVCMLGCNTIRGAGQDLERAGEAIQDAVQ